MLFREREKLSRLSFVPHKFIGHAIVGTEQAAVFPTHVLRVELLQGGNFLQFSNQLKLWQPERKRGTKQLHNNALKFRMWGYTYILSEIWTHTMQMSRKQMKCETRKRNERERSLGAPEEAIKST